MRVSPSVPLLFCGIALLATGCKHDGDVIRIPGWVETKSSGVAISLPSELTVTDLSNGDLSEIKRRAKSQYPNQPELEKVVEKLAASGAMKLVAISAGQGSASNQNSFSLVVQPVETSQTLATLVEPNRVQMNAVAVPGTLNVEMKQFPAGQSAYFQFDLASGAAPHTQATYILLRDSKEYVFTFSSSIADKRIWGSVGESAMKSVHFDD